MEERERKRVGRVRGGNLWERGSKGERGGEGGRGWKEKEEIKGRIELREKKRVFGEERK